MFWGDVSCLTMKTKMRIVKYFDIDDQGIRYYVQRRGWFHWYVPYEKEFRKCSHGERLSFFGKEHAKYAIEEYKQRKEQEKREHITVETYEF